ncbi:hypothetical protein PHISCL_11222, partial [Aspergillus sclerotialis]
MAVFLEDDLNIGAVLEQELQQELQQELNNEESAISPFIQGSPSPIEALDEPP